VKTRDLAYYMSCNYPYELIRDPEQGGYFATHPDLDGCAAQGETAEEAMAALDAARELWMETRLEDGLPVSEPAVGQSSGRVSLRMPSAVHAQLIKKANKQGVGLDLLLNAILSEYVGGLSARMRLEGILQQLTAVVAEVRNGARLTSTSARLSPSRPPGPPTNLRPDSASAPPLWADRTAPAGTRAA